MKLALSFLLLTSLAIGQVLQRRADRTFGLFNGRFWLKLSQEQRKNLHFRYVG